MITKVIVGFQSGADIGAARAARRFNIEVGGFMPLGFLTEDGPRPDYARLYGARETTSTSYPERTRRNAQSADATLWFGDPESRGGKLTLKTCKDLQVCKDHSRYGWLIVWPNEYGGAERYDWKAVQVVEWLAKNPIEILNVAGNRESNAPGNQESGTPGIGEWVERYLCEVFRLLGFREVEPTERAAQ